MAPSRRLFRGIAPPALEETGEADRLAMPILDCDRGKSAEDRCRFDVARNAALGGDLRPGTHLNVICDADLTSHHDAVIDHGAPGDTDLAANHAVAPETDVVPNVNEIVENSAQTDHGIAHSTAVNGAVGTDLHLIFNDDAAELKHPCQAIRARHEAEALRTDGYAGLDSDTPADQCMANAGVGSDPGIVAKPNPVAQHRIERDMASIADFGVAPNDGASVDLRALPDRRAGMHARSRIDAGFKSGRRIKEPPDLRVRKAWVLDEEKPARIACMPRSLSTDDDRAGAGPDQRFEITHIGEDADLARLSRVQGRNVMNEDLLPSRLQRFRLDKRSDLTQQKRARAMEEAKIRQWAGLSAKSW
jgi:hypothetical protein